MRVNPHRMAEDISLSLVVESKQAMSIARPYRWELFFSPSISLLCLGHLVMLLTLNGNPQSSLTATNLWKNSLDSFTILNPQHGHDCSFVEKYGFDICAPIDVINAS